MTLVLTQASERHVLQVADRLVTRDTGEPFDRLANKNVVYLCKDAIVTLGYTGIAYLNDMPTDIWLAERLTGWQLNSWGHVRFGTPAQYHFHEAMHALVHGLDNVLARQKLAFEVAIGGWKWGRSRRKRRRPAPVAMTITYFPGAGLKVNYPPRHWHYSGMAFRASPSLNLSRKLHARIWSELLRLRGHADSERILVEAVRATASANARVGGDCMSILLAPPHVRCYGRVRFLPVNVVLQTIHPRRSPLPVVFSPWVITPGSVTAPAIMVGGAVVRWDQWSIEIEAPTSDVILWHSQERPKLQ